MQVLSLYRRPRLRQALSSLRSALRPLATYPSITFTAALALIFGSLFMSLTGGGLKPYEMQAMQAAMGWVRTDAEARVFVPHAGSRTAAHPASRYEPLEAPEDAELVLLGGDLLGGPLRERNRLPRQVLQRSPNADQTLADEASPPLHAATAEPEGV